MKELSIEEKAKSYDEAIERAESIYNETAIPSATTKGICTYIFPELKESEDEKIRKAIIEHFEGSHSSMYPYKGFTKEQIIAWLEKHGEKNYTEKVEPKFKVGDWVVRELDNTCYQIKKCILNVTNNKYGYDLTSGGYISSQDANFYHLWTISDAKAGDVLVSGDVIFILNKIHGVWVNCLCSLHKDGSFNNEDYDLMHIKYSKEVYPATKEQRDTLEKAMADSGWAFDFEKKELKKIEQKFTPKYKNGDCIEYRGGKYKITKVTVTPHNFFYDVSLIEVHSDSEEVVISIGMAAEEQMFKIEQKPAEWSEEDNKNLEKTIWYVEKGGKLIFKKTDKLVSWLKSLKDRYTWKPSDEQIKVCKKVYADILSAKGFDLGTVNSELNRMEEELKKLREE